MPKLQRTKHGQHFISLPLSLVKAKGWVKCQEIEITINKYGNLELKD